MNLKREQFIALISSVPDSHRFYSIITCHKSVKFINIKPGDIYADASHWVPVLQTVETRTGEEVIRIYNPFQNREEWISYEDLSNSWQLYPKHNRADEPMGPNFRAVIASPLEEMQWLPNP